MSTFDDEYEVYRTCYFLGKCVGASDEDAYREALDAADIFVNFCEWADAVTPWHIVTDPHHVLKDEVIGKFARFAQDWKEQKDQERDE